MVEPVWIEDPTDPRLDDYLRMTDVALRTRLETVRGLYMAESTKVIARALAAGHQPRSVLVPERWLDDILVLLDEAGANVPVFVGAAPIVDSITGFHVHRGALAAMERPELPPVADVLAGARRIAVLENLVDHTNVGAVFRSGAGLGLDGILVTPSCADPLYRRSVRVSMGGVFQVPWTRISPWPAGVDTLRAAGFTVAALALRSDAVTLDALADDVPDRLAFVLGAEGDGLAPETVAAADVVVRIPMAGGVDSLNVAAASAVAFWATRIEAGIT